MDILNRAQQLQSAHEDNPRFELLLAIAYGYCGDDEQGHTFGAAYKPNVAKLDKAIGNLVQGLGGIGDAFDVMTMNYLGGDSASQVRTK